MALWVQIAEEMIGDPAAAEGRAKLLGQPKMTGVGGFMRKTNAFPALIVAWRFLY